MLNYEENDMVMIPMALNAFYNNIPRGTKKIIYTKTVSISEEFLNVVLEYISASSEGKYIMIDMQNSDYAFRLFEKFQDITKPVIFVNINSEILRNKMKENIPGIQMSANENNGVINMMYDNTVESICTKYAEKISHKIYVDIIKDLIDEVSQNPIQPYRLDSSGLYSNMYVNVKRLFLYPEKYYAVVFGLAQKIADAGVEYDGFISSSKNGAILANLLGMLLDKKTIHVMGLGPKYSMNIGNVQREIKKRKNYIYVFDFRCTGTEMKLLSALVNANDAYIQGAVGIAIYKTEESDAAGKRMFYLVDIRKEGIPYKIAGEEKDIVALIDMQKREEYDYK